MDGLSALVLTTSLLGLTLTPPAGNGALLSSASPPGQQTVSMFHLLPEEAGEGDDGGGEVAAATDGDDLQERARQRRRLTRAHMSLGISTWASMTATLVLGGLQFADKYVFDDAGQNRCDRGEAILGSWNCDVPVMHLSFAILTTVLYSTAFALSFAMHDPELSQAEGDRAQRLRTHRILRWIHLAGMAIQIVEGLILANVDFGNNTAEQAIASIHLSFGALTWGALTWAGAIMLAR